MFCKILNPFSPFEHSICHILGMVGPIGWPDNGLKLLWKLEELLLLGELPNRGAHTIFPNINLTGPHEKNYYRELTVVTAPGPMIMAQSRLGEVTAQSRRGHSSVTARSQQGHSIFSMITAQSWLGHSSVTAGCDHFGRRELTVSSHGGQFFSHGPVCLEAHHYSLAHLSQ